MAPKEKVKRIMTPEQLEKLALARVKAGEARAAMKEDADGAKMAILQKKMDAIQGKKKPTPKAQPEPESMEEPIVSEPIVSEPTIVVSEPAKNRSWYGQFSLRLTSKKIHTSPNLAALPCPPV